MTDLRAKAEELAAEAHESEKGSIIYGGSALALAGMRATLEAVLENGMMTGGEIPIWVIPADSVRALLASLEEEA